MFNILYSHEVNCLFMHLIVFSQCIPWSRISEFQWYGQWAVVVVVCVWGGWGCPHCEELGNNDNLMVAGWHWHAHHIYHTITCIKWKESLSQNLYQHLKTMLQILTKKQWLMQNKRLYTYKKQTKTPEGCACVWAEGFACVRACVGLNLVLYNS